MATVTFEHERSEPMLFLAQRGNDFFRGGERSKMANPLDNNAKSRLSSMLGDSVIFDEPMARHTSFRIGGPADALAEPKTIAQLHQLLRWTTEEKINHTIIGGGTNLLVKDSGIRGVVTRLNRLAVNLTWKIIDTQVLITAGAGLPTRSLCAMALRNGWHGANFALGIPGFLGGAVIMNAGTASGNMAGITKSITLLTAHGRQMHLTADNLTWQYRRCQIPPAIGKSAIIVEMDLVLTEGDKKELHRQAQELMQQRSGRQPLGEPSAGSIFKNPSEDQPAGRLIDAAGLKGTRIGQAQISPRHANFIVNLGGASANDVMKLIDFIQKTISDRYNVELAPEVHIVG